MGPTWQLWLYSFRSQTQQSKFFFSDVDSFIKTKQNVTLDIKSSSSIRKSLIACVEGDEVYFTMLTMDMSSVDWLNDWLDEFVHLSWTKRWIFYHEEKQIYHRGERQRQWRCHCGVSYSRRNLLKKKGEQMVCAPSWRHVNEYGCVSSDRQNAFLPMKYVHSLNIYSRISTVPRGSEQSEWASPWT